MKEKYIQYCCDFYNEHSPKDREWFGRMYEQCQEDYEQQNMCMYHWQFPLMVLKAEQAQIDELNIKNQRYLGKMQEQQDQIAELKKELKEWKSKSLAARVLCETAGALLDGYAHQDAMVILDDLEEALRGASD